MTEQTPAPPIDVSTELAAQRTALAFERTRMAADNSQMSAQRTSLSLVGFGFTIFSFFHQYADTPQGAAIFDRARNFSLTLVILGVILNAGGLYLAFRHFQDLRVRRRALSDRGLLPDERVGWASPNVLVSSFMLIVGIGVLIGILARVGPFGE